MKVLLILSFLGLQQPFGTFPRVMGMPALFGCQYRIEVTKNPSYKGMDLEALYKVSCKDPRTGQLRTFEVIKSSKKSKGTSQPEYILTETGKQGRNYYPVIWDNAKMSPDEIKNECIQVLKEEIRASTATS